MADVVERARQMTGKVDTALCEMADEIDGLRSAISVALAHLTIDDERGAFNVLRNAEKGVFPGASVNGTGEE